MPRGRKRGVSSTSRVTNKYMKRVDREELKQELCQQMYDVIRSHRGEDGQLTCESFVRLPKRRSEPQYYDVIVKPMDLIKIQNKIRMEEYNTVEEMFCDVALLIDNAITYYKDDSDEHSRAVTLKGVFEETKDRLLSDSNQSEMDTTALATPTSDDEAPVKKRGRPPKEDTVRKSSSIVKFSPAVHVIKEKSPVRIRKWAPPPDDDDDDEDFNPANMKEDEESEDVLALIDASGERETEIEELSEADKLEMLFTTVATATVNNRELDEVFKVLPSKQKYPEYYERVSEPMDLKSVASKLETDCYSTVEELCDDLLLICQNIKSVHEPRSTLFKDAQSLRKIILITKHKLDKLHSGNAPRSEPSSVIGGESERGGAKSSLVSMMAGLKSHDEEMGENSGFKGVTVEVSGFVAPAANYVYENDLWALYNAVVSYRTSKAELMCQPFMKLPQKNKTTADYYKRIKNPLALHSIWKKLRAGQFEDVEALANDFNLVFENAKLYNSPTTQLYKDAVELQFVMRMKKQELLKAKEMAAAQALRQRLQLLYKTIFDYQYNGRRLVDVFVTLPSREQYPHYYEWITQPIDMTIIDNKIKADMYTSQEQLVEDIQLMFRNCKQCYEESSQVYQDSITLEQILLAKMRTLPPLQDEHLIIRRSTSHSSLTAGVRKGYVSSLSARLQELYDAVDDYIDFYGRTPSTLFAKHPSKEDMPQYHEAIEEPMDLDIIYEKMSTDKYRSIDDMISDISLMCDNACRFYEPKTRVYNGALSLLRLALKKREELTSGDDMAPEHPDVSPLVHELLVNLFDSTYYHTDEDGRYYSDSLMELPRRIEVKADDGSKKTTSKIAPSLVRIRYNLERGMYKRLDRFQADMFEVFDFARQVSSLKSQVYEDSVALQMFYIKRRDELCHTGQVLSSPALSGAGEESAVVERLREAREVKEVEEEEERRRHSELEAQLDEFTGEIIDKSAKPNPTAEAIEWQGVVYFLGDFIYVNTSTDPESSSATDPNQCQIMCIESLYKNDDTGCFCVYGCLYLRPNQTSHPPTRKFLDKEIFRGTVCESYPLGSVVGKCFVLGVREYFNYKPEGVEDDEIYVCESSYSPKYKTFKKIRLELSAHLRLVQRERPLIPLRVSSVPADRVWSGAEQRLYPDELNADVLHPARVVVIIEGLPGAEPDCTYYEQLNYKSLWIKLGDCVYVKSTDKTEPPLIASVDKLWTDSNNEAYLRGPLFRRPAQVTHRPTQLFYSAEVLRSSEEITLPVSRVVGRCVVLSHKEFCTRRVTEVNPRDVFLCESVYLESDQLIETFSRELEYLQKVTPSCNVCEDEIYFFKKPLQPVKKASPQLSQLLQMKGGEKKKGQKEVESASVTIIEDEQAGQKVAKKRGRKPLSKEEKDSRLESRLMLKKRRRRGNAVSGYLVYATEFRQSYKKKHPDMNFSQLSLIIGSHWQALSEKQKETYINKAKLLTAVKYSSASSGANGSAANNVAAKKSAAAQLKLKTQAAKQAAARVKPSAGAITVVVPAKATSTTATMESEAILVSAAATATTMEGEAMSAEGGSTLISSDTESMAYRTVLGTLHSLQEHTNQSAISVSASPVPTVPLTTATLATAPMTTAMTTTLDIGSILNLDTTTTTVPVIGTTSDAVAAAAAVIAGDIGSQAGFN